MLKQTCNGWFVLLQNQYHTGYQSTFPTSDSSVPHHHEELESNDPTLVSPFDLVSPLELREVETQLLQQNCNTSSRFIALIRFEKALGG